MLPNILESLTICSGRLVVYVKSYLFCRAKWQNINIWHPLICQQNLPELLNSSKVDAIITHN